jgi:hypothetical protein
LTNNKAITYVQVPTDNTYHIRENQSNYDVCIQLGYGLDRYGNFIALSGLPCDIINNVGSQISVTKLQTNVGNIIFATLSEDVIPTPPITGGIGWMTIGTTFIVA